MPKRVRMHLTTGDWTAPDRCYWHRYGDGDVLIPMCVGAAVHGPDGCTCDVPQSLLEQAQRRRDTAEQEVCRLRSKLERAGERIADGLAKHERMRRRLADAVMCGARAMAAAEGLKQQKGDDP